MKNRVYHFAAKNDQEYIVQATSLKKAVEKMSKAYPKVQVTSVWSPRESKLPIILK